MFPFLTPLSYPLSPPSRQTAAFLLLYEPLRYASRYLILSPYLSSSPNFLPLTLSSDVFFAVFYCTVMKSEMEVR